MRDVTVCRKCGIFSAELLEKNDNVCDMCERDILQEIEQEEEQY